jgi:uncharacterized membrane protein YoaK (UPF0700 family)
MNQPSASRRDGLLVVLAFTTGAVNAVTFLRLGNVFSSVVTGNLVLLGVAAGDRHASLALGGGLALAGFSVGVLAGSAIAGTPSEGQPPWPHRTTVTLTIELLVLAGFSGGWLATGGRPSGAARLALLGVAAVVMWLQTAAVRRLGPMSTTYLTSTMAGMLQALAVRRWPSDWQRGVGIMAALVLGAVLGAVTQEWLPALIPVVVMVPVAAVAARCWPSNRGTPHKQPAGG